MGLKQEYEKPLTHSVGKLDRLAASSRLEDGLSSNRVIVMNLILFAIDPSELGTAQRPPEILETQTGDAFVAGLTGFGIIILWIAIVLVCLAIHFIPTIIAAIRRHHNTVPVFLVNLFFGWSFIGWVVALIWACTTPPVTKVVIVGDDRM